MILRNFQPGMKIYLYFQPWKEETWDSQNYLTGKKSNIWECWDTLRVVVPVNNWKSVQGGSECQILPSTRTNAHTYMNLNTREFQYIHYHAHTHSHENMKTTKTKLLHYAASELCLHIWKDINQQLTHWPAHVFILNITQHHTL